MVVAVSLRHLHWHQSHLWALCPSTSATLSSSLLLRRPLPVLLVVSSRPTGAFLHRHRTPTVPFQPPGRGARAPQWTRTTSRRRKDPRKMEKELDEHRSQQLPQCPPAPLGWRRFSRWSRLLLLPLPLRSFRWATSPVASPAFRCLPLLLPRPVLQKDGALWARLVQSLNRDLRSPRPWLQP